MLPNQLTIPSWLMPWEDIYFTILKQEVVVVTRSYKTPPRYVGVNTYTNEAWSVREIHKASGYSEELVQQAINDMVNNGLIIRRDRVGVRLVHTGWHKANLAAMLNNTGNQP